MTQHDESRLPRWAQHEMQNLRGRAEDAEQRLRDAVAPEGEPPSDEWSLIISTGFSHELLRLPINGHATHLQSPLGFSFHLRGEKPGLLNVNLTDHKGWPRRERVAVIPQSSNVVALGATLLFGGDLEGEV